MGSINMLHASAVYGHRSPTRHAHGSIQLAADLGRDGGSLTNLRRLIAMKLQDVFPEPEAETIRGPRGDVEVCTATLSSVSAAARRMTSRT